MTLTPLRSNRVLTILALCCACWALVLVAVKIGGAIIQQIGGF